MQIDGTSWKLRSSHDAGRCARQKAIPGRIDRGTHG